jgi:hypothetical protein
MDEKALDVACPLEAYKAALAEERRLWRQVCNAESSPVDRVIAYAQWRASAERVKMLAITLHDPERWTTNVKR